MKRLVPFLALTLVGCGLPKSNLYTVAPTYVGVWRTGSSSADYKLVEIFKDNSISLFGTKLDMIAPIDLKGDEMIVSADKATTKGPNFQSIPEFPNDHFPFKLKHLSETKIEMTDSSGLFLGVKTPVTLEHVGSDTEDSTKAQIMQRSANGG